ncbi:MAG: hypothetical protein LBV67_08055 [Streptococcaceae bacterium]|jgi:hypothetical protein|nr:hypothetical protein [Streptococcaceae bacterium]
MNQKKFFKDKYSMIFTTLILSFGFAYFLFSLPDAVFRALKAIKLEKELAQTLSGIDWSLISANSIELLKVAIILIITLIFLMIILLDRNHIKIEQFMIGLLTIIAIFAALIFPISFLLSVDPDTFSFFITVIASIAIMFFPFRYLWKIALKSIHNFLDSSIDEIIEPDIKPDIYKNKMKYKPHKRKNKKYM